MAGKLYGLTCGYWTDDPDDLDRHALAHPGKGDSLMDLCDCHNDIPTDIELRKCADGVE